MRSDWIVLSEMSVPCVLGLHEWERQNPQALVAEVSLALDLDEAASGDLAASVDYAAVLSQVELIALHGRWRLLESMAAAMARHLLSQPAPGEARAQVEWVRIKVTKPDIFGGRAVPGVELLRSRAWSGRRCLTHTNREGVNLESLTEAPETGAIMCPSSREFPGRCSSIRRRRWSPGPSAATIVVWCPVIAVVLRASCVPTRAHARAWSS